MDGVGRLRPCRGGSELVQGHAGALPLIQAPRPCRHATWALEAALLGSARGIEGEQGHGVVGLGHDIDGSLRERAHAHVASLGQAQRGRGALPRGGSAGREPRLDGAVLAVGQHDVAVQRDLVHLGSGEFPLPGHGAAGALQGGHPGGGSVPWLAFRAEEQEPAARFHRLALQGAGHGRGRSLGLSIREAHDARHQVLLLAQDEGCPRVCRKDRDHLPRSAPTHRAVGQVDGLQAALLVHLGAQQEGVARDAGNRRRGLALGKGPGGRAIAGVHRGHGASGRDCHDPGPVREEPCAPPRPRGGATRARGRPAGTRP